MMNKVLLAWLFGVAIALSSRGQDFTNLDFESARVIILEDPALSSTTIATSNAVPGWSVSDGRNDDLPWVYYNHVLSGSPLVGLEVSNQWVLDGNFSLYFGLSQISISQTGFVPSGAESLLFDATSSSLLLSLGGRNLSFMAISNAVNSSGLSYTIYGANVSGFAGKVETLTFSSSLPNDTGEVGLNNIQFSPQAIPEPSASLIFLGTGILFCVRRRKRP